MCWPSFERRRSGVDGAQQQRVLVAQLDAQQYTTPSPLTQSSIGGHVRHSLDHFRFLVDAEEKCVDYDTRNRGTTVETDPAVAAAEIDALCGLFCELTEDQLGQDLRCSFMMSGGGDRQEFESNMKRELFFCTHHAIHHNALIKIIASELGLGHMCPSDMGMAPSTLNFNCGR
eukprot:CAMPEP_0170169988 /NCGR_PEP_ID=MMETSP0040_2-20121228/2937_1 /TAXON_ID=641309 /ORGANISM="Lotharella oceanica, Strain CCMP622" /LENGTH=172 /DNA_ID=CAMNT_0010409067 /DNA_START=104 /DNA_END=623 /DNA_ORIENTATION=-